MTQCNYLFILEAERGSLRVDARQSRIWVLRWQLHNVLKGNRFILALDAFVFSLCEDSKFARDDSSHLNIWFLVFCRCDVACTLGALGWYLRESSCVFRGNIKKKKKQTNKPVMVQETAYVNVFFLGWTRSLLSCWVPSLRCPRN